MIIPNKQNPLSVEENSSFQFTLYVDGEFACQWLHIDNVQYAVRRK